MTTSAVSTLILPGQRGVRWHRFVESREDSRLAVDIDALMRSMSEHRHQSVVVNSTSTATEEARLVRARVKRVRDAGVTSAAALDLPERIVISPIISFGLFEGELFEIFEHGMTAGVRLVFVGTRDRFGTMPYRMMNSLEVSAGACTCDLGF